MTDHVKRPYNSARRRDQARVTRARIRDAAAELFVEHGYAATAVAAIAQRAGVAPQTVYAAFGTKSAMLVEAIGVAMVGDDEPVAVYERPEARDVGAAGSPADAASAIAGLCRRLLERASGLIHAAEAAAASDPELAELAAGGHRARLTDMRRFARDLDRAGLLRAGLRATDAADLLFVIASPETYRSLTGVRGWSPGRYETWLRTTLERVVLRD
jgi:AcrR family transcriptional regulator